MRRLEGISHPSQRDVLVREFCLTQGPAVAVEALHALVREAVRGRHRGTWLTVASALTGGAIPYDVHGDLYRAAVAGGFDVMRHLLIGGEVAHKTARDEDFARDDLLDGLTLGERKAKARALDRNLLARMLNDGDPAVIRVLLRNPRITEQEVLRLAAKRPNRAAVLREIARVSRWICRPRIQRALLLNPYTPVRVSVVLMPLMSAQDLHQFSRDKSLHPLTVAIARELLDLRGWETPTFH
ncbi:MAG: hypothetical protein ACQEXJ_03915 [Myxococcota bacterium]